MTFTIPYKNLDLYHTLISGQTFEWDFDVSENTWSGSIYENAIKIQQIGNNIEGELKYESEENLDSEITKYFGLEDDYEDLINKISFDKNIAPAIEKLYGLRVIQQDPWLCINSFILSQNNTVKNIQNSLRNISNLVRQRNTNSTFTFYPKYEDIVILSKQDLTFCKTGYRADYLLDFYSKIENNNNWLTDLNNLNYIDAKNKLIEVKGIGEKVADCILLYAYGKYEAYPLDTHLRQATKEIFFSDSDKTPSDKEIRKWASQYWGSAAGFAHFFLFTYHRIYGRLK